jgi:phage terminase large subunit GpA-like protein
MATFLTSKLSIRACSPTWEETSRIYRSYQMSDQRRPYCQCPKCEHWQYLDFFKHVHWQKSEDGKEHYPDTAAIFCESCGEEWSENERIRLVTTKHAIRHMQTREFTCCGERQEPMKERLWDWDDTLQVGYAKCKVCGGHPVSNEHAGFQVSKLYSPFTTVVDLARKWVESKDDPDTKQTFYNTQLGLPFRAEVSKEIDQHWLASRREQYVADVPEGVVVITAGIDVQDGGKVNEGRIEVEVVGWGLGEESWSLGTEVFYGNPAQPAVWKLVDAYLLKPWRHQRGFDLYIAGACIDSGGRSTQDTYKFARARIGRNIWAIKGASDKSGQWSPLWPPQQREEKHKKFRQGFRPVIIGVNAGKEAIRQRLLIEEPGPGYCHFPIERPQGWFEQMTAEDLVLEKRMGVTIRIWKLKKGRANEALDTRVYAYAALQGLMHTRGLDLNSQAALIAAMVGRADDEEAKAPEAPRRQVRQSDWMK